MLCSGCIAQQVPSDFRSQLTRGSMVHTPGHGLASLVVGAWLQVLASKQSAATRAREAEHETGHKLHLYLASFLAKLGGSALPASH